MQDMEDNNTLLITYAYTSPIGEWYIERKKIGGEEIDNALERYKTFLEAKYRKENTVLRYHDAAEKLLEHTNEINQETIQKYVAYLNQNYKQNTIANNIYGMNKFLEYLKLEDLKIPTPKWGNITRDTITVEKIKEIREYAKEHCDIQEYLFVLLITDNDCRNHEITRMQWNWIKGNKIYFKDCKTGDTTGHLTLEIQETLEKWKQERGCEGYVFINTRSQYKGLPLSERGWKIRQLIKKITRETIGRELCPQDLRASVITEEYNHYVNPKIIQRKARHRSWKTTMKYNHVDDQMLEDYLANENIFNSNSSNKELLFEGERTNNTDKKSHIKPLWYEPRELIPDNENEDPNTFSFSISIFYDCLDQAFFDRNGMNEGSSEVTSLGVGHCFSYIYEFSPPYFFDMLSNPNTSYSISCITHGHALNCYDTRQGISYFLFSPHHLQTSPASELLNHSILKSFIYNSENVTQNVTCYIQKEIPKCYTFSQVLFKVY